MTVIDEVKQKLDILEVVGQYVQLTKSGRTFRAPCPFHSEKKPSFFVYPEQQTWHCFGACNTGGDVFSFIMKKEGVDFGDALRLLAERTGVVIPSQAKSEAEDRARERIFQINQAAAQYFHNLLLNSQSAEKARRYLEGRGLNDKSVANFQLGYSPAGWELLKQYLFEKGYSESELLDAGLIIQSEAVNKTHDRFRDHLMFPIMDEKGRVSGFGARVLDPAAQGPKYINSPQTRVFDKSGTLYGFHLAKSAIREKNLAVMVEGYMDVIVPHQFGFANVIAPMGVAITEKQINQIKKLTRSIALALDPDAAGEEAAIRCIGYENALDAEVKVITLPPGKDPDEVVKEDSQQWQNLVDKAIPVIEYAINTVTSRLDLKTTRGKTEAISTLLPIVAEVKNGTRQDSYLQMLSDLTGTTRENLISALKRVKPDRKVKETKMEAVRRATRSVSSSPVEEYALTILLQHPELKARCQDMLAEYFENSENSAIFDKWRQCRDTAAIKELLDPAIKEHFDSLVARNLPDNRVEERYADCVLRLRERYLRNLKRKQEELLTLEAESGDGASVLAKMKEQGIEINEELAKIFVLRAKPHTEVTHEKH